MKKKQGTIALHADIPQIGQRHTHRMNQRLVMVGNMETHVQSPLRIKMVNASGDVQNAPALPPESGNGSPQRRPLIFSDAGNHAEFRGIHHSSLHPLPTSCRLPGQIYPVRMVVGIIVHPVGHQVKMPYAVFRHRNGKLLRGHPPPHHAGTP